MPNLRIITQEKESTVEIDKPNISIGRAEVCDIVINDKKSSRKHFTIELIHGNQYKLVDNESMNGTKVNGAFVNQCVLKHGDKITIGSIVIIFESEIPATIKKSSVTAPTPSIKKKKKSRKIKMQKKSNSSTVIFGLFGIIAVIIIALIAIKIHEDKQHDRFIKKQWDDAFGYFVNKDFDRSYEAFSAIKYDSIYYPAAQAYKKKIDKLKADASSSLSPAIEEGEYDQVNEFMKSSEANYKTVAAKMISFLRKYPNSSHKNEFYLQLKLRGWKKEDIDKAIAGEMNVDKSPVNKPEYNSNNTKNNEQNTPYKNNSSNNSNSSDYNKLNSKVKSLLSNHNYSEAISQIKDFMDINFGSNDYNKAEQLLNMAAKQAYDYYDKQDKIARKYIKNGNVLKAKEIYRNLLTNLGKESMFFELRMKIKQILNSLK